MSPVLGTYLLFLFPVPKDLPKIVPVLLRLSGTTPGLAPEQSVEAYDLEAIETALDEIADGEAVEPTKTKTAAQIEAQVLEGPTSIFLRWLSQINTRVVNDTNPAQHANLDRLRGSIRNEPTFFIHRCRYESDG